MNEPVIGRPEDGGILLTTEEAMAKIRTESSRPIIVYDQSAIAAEQLEPEERPKKAHEILSEMNRVPQLTLWGDPVLEMLCEKVDDFGPDLWLLISDLKARFGTLPHGQKGYALAAPQIGVPKAVAYVHCPDDKKNVLHEFVMVNPAIVRKGKKIRVMEGCLSIPHFFHTIERRYDLTVVYKDEKGIVRSINAKGRLAQVVQHEVDHLHGTLLINHIKERQARRAAEREIRRYRK